jgi:uncharacterized protein (DUF1697 family)
MKEPDKAVAFLRAVNVAGHQRVRMVRIRDAFEAAGCSDVKTYGHSANVVFTCRARDRRTCVRRAADHLEQELGGRPVVFIRTATDIEAVVAQAPFSEGSASDSEKRYVAFLQRKSRRKVVLPQEDLEERLKVVGARAREVFVVSSRKESGFYGFPNQFVEDLYGGTATSRNWNTVQKILALMK